MPIWLLLGISAAGAPTVVLAEVHVEGTVAAARVTTDKDAIPDVLSAFGAPFNLRYRTTVPLVGNVSSVYSGSLAHVISRLLGDYNYYYVVVHDQGTYDQGPMEIVVLGKRGEAPMPAQIPGPHPRVSDVSVDSKTYSTCMALWHDVSDCTEVMKRLTASAH
jgi:hypothetical protein